MTNRTTSRTERQDAPRTGRAGHGRAFGAVTVVNATATGTGCSLAVAAATEAEWTWGGEGFRFPENGAGDALAKAVWDQARIRLGMGETGASAAVRCPFPPSRGLKTSSSVAAALLRAAASAAGRSLPDATVEAAAVQASRDAGVTLTGALDDQAACVRGGCHVTDNRSGQILQSLSAPPLHVAIWVPEAAIPKALLRNVDVSAARDGATEALRLARAGRIAEAMTANGRAYLATYRDAGFPVDGRPVEVALRQGARGAGLSGTGPAVAALFDRPIPLPSVPGGAWTWTKVAP